MNKLILALMITVGLTACGKSVNPDTLVTTDLQGWTKGGFGAVIIADFKITNNTDKPVKDITVRCGGYSETKTRIDENKRVVYKEIKPGQTIVVEGFNMGFVGSNVSSIACLTTKFESI
jgi:hypothetical protein